MMEVEDNLPLPRMSEESVLLTSNMLRKVGMGGEREGEKWAEGVRGRGRERGGRESKEQILSIFLVS